MNWKTFKLYPWVYYYRGTNGATLYDWLNGKILSLNNEQAKVLEELIKGTSEDFITEHEKFIDRLKSFGFISPKNIYIDNITVGSKLQKAMQFINTFQVQRLDLVLSTPCDRYDSCPVRIPKIASHACESCLGCAREEKSNKNISHEKIMKLLKVFRPPVVTLSGGELFTDAPLVESVLSLLLTAEYPQITVLIMPLHAIMKFKNEIAKHVSMFAQKGRNLVLTAVLTKHGFKDIPKILEIGEEFNIPLTFVVYINLDEPPVEISRLNNLQKTATIVPAFYSLSGRNILENLKEFLNVHVHPINSYIAKSISIESLTRVVEYNYAQCLYGNLLIKFPEEEISTCKGYYLLNYKLRKLSRKALQEVMSLWDDPCEDCSLKGACTMCRTTVRSLHITPNSCPIWKKALEVEK
ncbi:hypothetical protein E3E36_00655 [Thermococcus sp. M36]|uniref:hypothetical protein n=1 Tax=Thermococcus sp. M36 TaxID=1638261 RepID=UPI00143A2BFA|nr:hypothetical protein [Thermococcus sp. M36]NJE04683.1 hypothetical protein [Thermococcus sp. M36]